MAIRLAAEAASSLPMAPEVYGLIALAVFALLLVVTLSFRNVSNKH